MVSKRGKLINARITIIEFLVKRLVSLTKLPSFVRVITEKTPNATTTPKLIDPLSPKNNFFLKLKIRKEVKAPE